MTTWARRFTLAERGAYCALLFQSWNTGPLPTQPNRLAILIGCTPREFAAVWKTVRRKFIETPAGLVNVRLEEHRARALAKVKGHIEGAAKTNEKLGRGTKFKVVSIGSRDPNLAVDGTLSVSLSDSASESLGVSHPIQSNLREDKKPSKGGSESLRSTGGVFLTDGAQGKT